MDKQQKGKVLVIDDDRFIREMVTEILEIEGYQVEAVDAAVEDPSGREFVCDVAVLDMVMPKTDGVTIAQQIAQYSPRTQIIYITAYPDKGKVEKVTDLGAFSFLTKPFTADQLRYAVAGAFRTRIMTGGYDLPEGTFEKLGLIGTSPVMQAVRSRTLELALTGVPVLITGESGTGKEVVSGCIHHLSKRSNGPFTALNCAGLSPNLIESELFGHAQGAFTGAVRTKFGFFEVTDGGTLFLDEIGDLPLDLQSRLLRILDSGEYVRVGETITRRVDVRIVSATNRDLANMVSNGGFRSDLYFRLRGSQITLPPLRERPEDIPDLVSFFLRNSEIKMSGSAMELLCKLQWPGNVRELALAVSTMIPMASHKVISRDTATRALGRMGKQTVRERAFPAYKEFKDKTIREAERAYFRTLLQECRGNISHASKIAGMHRKNFYDKLKQLGLGDTVS